jgi:hypothetical protein
MEAAGALAQQETGMQPGFLNAAARAATLREIMV